jgi:alkyl hydroperoxide reductase subunit D
MEALESIRARLPEAAKDIRLNLSAVLQPGGVLSPAQRWGTAIAVAHAVKDSELASALTSASRTEVGDEVADDARAMAALMAMNNVYYRFRHLIAKPSYAQMSPRLRMTRLARPATNKLDCELFALAVSAVNACGTCVQAHEKAVLDGGLTEEHVHDAVRIAATVAAASTASSMRAESAQLQNPLPN